MSNPIPIHPEVAPVSLPEPRQRHLRGTLQRSGSLRNDIQTENLKNGHFWSLQLGSGRALAATRAPFSFSARSMLWCSFWINLRLKNVSQRFMMASLGPPPLLNSDPCWERACVRSRGSCTKSRHSWPQTCSKSYAHQIFAAFWCSDMGIFFLTSSKKTTYFCKVKRRAIQSREESSCWSRQLLP